MATFAYAERAKGLLLLVLRKFRGDPADRGAPDTIGERATDGDAAAATGLLRSGVPAPDRVGETAARR